MEPPFTQSEFFRVMTEYNLTVYPAQPLLLALAVVALVSAVRGGRAASSHVALVLGILWIWMGIVYHWMRFTAINPAAWAFGAFFVLEGILLIAVGFGSRRLRFRPRRDAYGVAGGVLVLYALVLYPLIGLALGHGWPEHPTFGLPCPTTIFTIGLLLWAVPRVPWPLLVVPVAWSLVGSTAAALFGVWQDLALPVAGLLGGGMILWRNRSAATGAGGATT